MTTPAEKKDGFDWKMALEDLRQKLGAMADGIEQTYGAEDPAARAFRVSIGKIYEVIHHDDF